MKKLELRALELGAKELLTRAQMKKLLGGSGGADTCQNECGGINGDCDEGCHCDSIECPDNKELTHTVCMAD
ncbi:unnamed protein product [Phaeothamnion confervicola]